jgi:AcrR family transcriptional regulator
MSNIKEARPMTARARMRPTRRRIHRAALQLFVEKGSTQLTVSELATAAGVARGTVYNQLGDDRALFEEVAEHLVAEMSERLAVIFEGIEDPAARMAIGIRHYVRRAHEEPDWGRFVIRFAFNSGPMQRLWLGGPGENLRAGIQARRYAAGRNQVRTMLGMIVGGVLSAMAAVCEGEEAWRAAGCETAELVLFALGIERKQARALACAPLPPLPPVH